MYYSIEETKYYRQWMKENVHRYTNRIGDVDITGLAEECAERFGRSTPDGTGEIEEIIFEVASEFFVF